MFTSQNLGELRDSKQATCREQPPWQDDGLDLLASRLLSRARVGKQKLRALAGTATCVSSAA